MTHQANKVGRVAPRAPVRCEQVRRGTSCRACSWSEDSLSPIHGARGAASPYPSGSGQHLLKGVPPREPKRQLQLRWAPPAAVCPAADMTDSPGPTASWLPRLAAGSLLAALTFALYWPAHAYDFINYDDPDYVLRNPFIAPGLTRAGLQWAFGQLHGFATYWHPLTWVSHMIDCQLFGLAAGKHHLTNVVLHTINAVLLFAVWQRMTRAPWASFVVAALFAWHPLQVDTVAWISERKNLLGGCFWFLTLLAYVRYAERPGLIRYGCTLLPFTLGLMCKPVLVTLPCVLL